MIRSSMPWTAKQISKMVDNGSLTFDNIIQRGKVWDNKRKSLLVYAMVKGYSVTPFYTIKTDNKVKTPKGEVAIFDCIDGKQRCTTINSFKNGGFKLSGVEKTVTLEDGSEYDLNGKYYDDLPEEVKDVFDNYQLGNYYYSDITPEEVAEQMWLINNGKPLTPVENSRIKAYKELPTLRGLAKHLLFTENLSETSLRGYNNEDMVIKAYIQLTEEEPCFDNKVTRPFYSHTMDSEVVKRLNRIFTSTKNVVDEVKDMAAQKVIDKKSAAKVIKKNNLLGVIDLVANNLDTEGYDEGDMAQFVAAFFDAPDGLLTISTKYNDASYSGTGHVAAVKQRREAMAEEYAKWKEER